MPVTVVATDDTGLIEPDVHYWGNAIGESGNDPNNALVDGIYFAGARDNPHKFINEVAVDDMYDFKRDSFVDGVDLAIIRENTPIFLTALKLLTVPEDEIRIDD